MKRIFGNENGQLILIACVSIVLVLVLIAIYESYTLATGENSIKSENRDSFYYYMDIRNKYIDISGFNKSKFEGEMMDLSLLHGYSVNFIHNGGKTTIIFVDKDIRIVEELT